MCRCRISSTVKSTISDFLLIILDQYFLISFEVSTITRLSGNQSHFFGRSSCKIIVSSILNL